MKAVQRFTDEYLAQCKDADPDAIVEFLESFRLIHQPASRSKLISMKVPEPLLTSFRRKCEIEGIKYQTQIKKLMEEWLAGQMADCDQS